MTETAPKLWWTVGAQAVAIVASILVAFAIDAWWEERGEQRWQTAQLVALRDEFAANGEGLNRVVGMDTRIAQSIQEAVVELKAHEAGDTVQMDASRIAALTGWRTSDIATGALDALLASGRLGDIDNAELRQALADWPSVVQDVREDEALARDFLPNVLVPGLLGQGVIDLAYESQYRIFTNFRERQDAPPEMVSVTVTPELIELATVRVSHARLAAGSVGRLQKKLGTITDMIDAELEARGVSHAPAEE